MSIVPILVALNLLNQQREDDEEERQQRRREEERQAYERNTAMQSNGTGTSFRSCVTTSFPGGQATFQ